MMAYVNLIPYIQFFPFLFYLILLQVATKVGTFFCCKKTGVSIQFPFDRSSKEDLESIVYSAAAIRTAIMKQQLLELL